ncbi:MAG: hypothetical protein RQ801_03095 [Spirochaetaceae bacterium]|nr:hypothetical protein [Spirochaetaceae bacterium]MDT8297262.1 hypothetical protein [Spirochaetaceae bacterium]
MGKIFTNLDTAIQNHLRMIRESSGLPDDDDSLELLARGWREKESAFIEQVGTMGMEAADEATDLRRGFLALTQSGSLVAVGPDNNGARRAVYVSIDRRRDVPARAESEDARISGEVAKGKEIIFDKGPVKQSSAVYLLALLPSALALTDQNEKLDEATLALTKEFQAVDETRFDEV